MICHVFALWSRYDSRSSGGRVSNASIASAVAVPTLRSPVVDMIDVSDSTRSGWSIAIRCTIIPPIETPTTCARSMPSAESSAMPSVAMSASVYAGGSPVDRDVSPTSRLSNAITRKPLSTRPWMSVGSQLMSCEVKPLTRSSGLPSTGPVSS